MSWCCCRGCDCRFDRGLLLRIPPSQAIHPEFRRCRQDRRNGLRSPEQGGFHNAGRLAADGVTRFVEVQRAITSQLGAHLENLKQKYNSVSGEGSQNPGIAEFITFWKDFSGTILKAKQIQVEALNSANFSLDEYRWVRSSFYQALGAKFVSLNLDRALTAIKEQNPDLLKGDQADAEQLAPEQNQKLVEPYTQEAQNWIAYAWLGL